MSKQCAVEERRSRSGLYLGPWAVRVLAGLLGLSAVTVLTVVAREVPYLARYAKSKSM